MTDDTLNPAAIWNEPQPSCAQTTIATSPPPLNSSAATSVAKPPPRPRPFSPATKPPNRRTCGGTTTQPRSSTFVLPAVGRTGQARPRRGHQPGRRG